MKFLIVLNCVIRGNYMVIKNFLRLCALVIIPLLFSCATPPRNEINSNSDLALQEITIDFTFQEITIELDESNKSGVIWLFALMVNKQENNEKIRNMCNYVGSLTASKYASEKYFLIKSFIPIEEFFFESENSLSLAIKFKYTTNDPTIIINEILEKVAFLKNKTYYDNTTDNIIMTSFKPKRKLTFVTPDKNSIKILSKDVSTNNPKYLIGWFRDKGTYVLQIRNIFDSEGYKPLLPYCKDLGSIKLEQ